MAQNDGDELNSPKGGEVNNDYTFEAEVGKLLDLMINSLYRDKEIFLRELISNASDSCDKLRYKALTDSSLMEDNTNLGITISINKSAKTLTISDSGIGMNRDELVSNLGTIAKSGTESFIASLKDTGSDDTQLIGQFGVGFYSVFMVANKVEFRTRRAGDSEGWRWISEGRGSFTIQSDEEALRGAEVVLFLREDAIEFLDESRIAGIVTTYSDHIDIPIHLKEPGSGERVLNDSSAIWARSKADLSVEKYNDFYKHLTSDPSDPWKFIHMHAEGAIDYTALLFIPDSKPFDLFEVTRQHKVKLYAKKVFITDECEGLLPAWLRFLRGVVDSSDLALNISRETLQHNPILAKINSGLTKRVLSELKGSSKDLEVYEKFWENFGAVLKEGIYEDTKHKDEILKLSRFKSTKDVTKWISLEEYINRMPKEQSAIYYLSGDDQYSVLNSPHLEGFRARDIEVLLMTDPVDQFWLPSVGEWMDKPFKSVTQGGLDLEALSTEEDNESSKEDNIDDGTAKLIAVIKINLGDSVKDVRISERLTDSPVCLVADEGDVDIHLQRLLQAHKQDLPEQQRVLEINVKHEMIKYLVELLGEDSSSGILSDASHLLLDQAKILEGGAPSDPPAFSRRLSALVAQSSNKRGNNKEKN
tara:strand:- start:12127 stop:14064 length:1938 start_codon:yes stop_codon:yes gene_type:complete